MQNIRLKLLILFIIILSGAFSINTVTARNNHTEATGGIGMDDESHEAQQEEELEILRGVNSLCITDDGGFSEAKCRDANLPENNSVLSFEMNGSGL